jgi:hypothetical protein
MSSSVCDAFDAPHVMPAVGCAARLRKPLDAVDWSVMNVPTNGEAVCARVVTVNDSALPVVPPPISVEPPPPLLVA